MTTRWLVRSALLLMSLGGLVACAADTTAPLSADSAASGISIKATPDISKGTVGVQFAGSGTGVVFSVSGGSEGASYYWTVSGTVPPGLALLPTNNSTPSSTLTLYGTPSTGGVYSLQITVHTAPNHLLLISGANFPIEIAGDSGSPPVISPLALTWLTGVPNQLALTATGGKTPYKSWFATNLPSDITLNAETGTLSGTPSTPGTYNMTVSVVDSAGRTGAGNISLTVKTWTLAEIKGTWTGIITTDPHPRSGQRLSLLFNDKGVVQQGTVGATVLATSTQSLTFTIDSGKLSGQIPILGWHLICTSSSSGDLDCVGHDLSGTTPKGDVVLKKINANNQDTVAPTVVSGVYAAAAADGTGGPRVTVVFSELMSGPGTASTSIVLSGGSGTVGTPTFASTDPTAVDARTLTILLSQLQSSTNYTLTLNPTGKTDLRDIAGNILATKAIPFGTAAANVNVNQPPKAAPLTLTAEVTKPRPITLTGSDPENGTLTFTVATQPAVGTLTGTAPNLTYTSNVIGKDSFTFTVTDPALNTSAPATVTIDTRAANQAPKAIPQSVNIVHDRPVVITLAGTDPDAGDTITAYTISSNPTKGTLTGAGAAKTYTPNAGKLGPDSFEFTVTDSAGAVSAPATVAIAITNQAPTALPQAVTVLKYELGSSSPVTLAGSDPDGDTLTYTIVPSVPSSTHGEITGGAGSARTYYPPAGFSGQDSFSFTVSDGVSTSTAATLNIFVSPNSPPTANPQTLTFYLRQPIDPLYQNQHPITLTGSADTVKFRIITWPKYRDTDYLMGPDPTTGETTTGAIVYTPLICHTYFVTDSLTFVAIAADGLASAPATVTMNFLGSCRGH